MLLKIQKINVLSEFMHHINSAYGKYYNKKCYHILINRYLSVVNDHILLSSLPPTGLTTCRLERLFFTNVIILSSIKDKIIIFAAKKR